MNDDDNEFRARLFAFKWGRDNYRKGELKPYTVSEGNEQMDKHWKNYLVLLMGKGGENKLTKVCFPADVEDNFAIVTGLNKECTPKVNKIREYKILDTGDYTISSQMSKDTKIPMTVTKKPHFKKKKITNKKKK